MAGGGAAAPLILERHLKTEGWSTNIAAVQIGYNSFFLIVNILIRKICCKQFQSISYYVKKIMI